MRILFIQRTEPFEGHQQEFATLFSHPSTFKHGVAIKWGQIKNLAHPTPGWHYWFSENMYDDSKISLEWLMRVQYSTPDQNNSDVHNGKPPNLC